MPAVEWNVILGKGEPYGNPANGHTGSGGNYGLGVSAAV